MIAGEDGGGGLLPLLLPPRECDIASSARAVSAIRGETKRQKNGGKPLDSRHANDVKACGARYDAKLVTNYYCYS